MIIGHSDYNGVHEPVRLQSTVDAIITKLKAMWAEGVRFDALAFRGMSGAGVAYPVSYATGIPVVCVRKASDNSHGSEVESSDNEEIEKYLIIDDFISSGETIWNIIVGMNKTIYFTYEKAPKCAGILLYETQPMKGSPKEHIVRRRTTNVTGKETFRQLPYLKNAKEKYPLFYVRPYVKFPEW